MPEQSTKAIRTYLPMPEIQGYTEIRPLGKGGFGSVYLVRDESHRMLALKVILRREIDDYRYNREYESICTCGDFNHPDLIPILHVGTGEDFFYYTMRLADDASTGQKLNAKSTDEEIAAYKPKTLSSEIKANGGHMRVKAAAEAMIPVLSALEFLHAKNLLHRDVKPDNIVYLDGKPVLGDIGLVTEQTDDTMTMVASFGYTPEGGAMDVPGDLYSVGKTLHCAVGGDIARPGLAVPTILLESPDPLYQALNKIILKASNLSYTSAEKMKKDLTKVFRKKPNSTKRETTKTPILKAHTNIYTYMGKYKYHASSVLCSALLCFLGFWTYELRERSRNPQNLFNVSSELQGDGSIKVQIRMNKQPNKEIGAVQLDITVGVKVKEGGTTPAVAVPNKEKETEIIVYPVTIDASNGESDFTVTIPKSHISQAVRYNQYAILGAVGTTSTSILAGLGVIYHVGTELCRTFKSRDDLGGTIESTSLRVKEVQYKDGSKWIPYKPKKTP